MCKSYQRHAMTHQHDTILTNDVYTFSQQQRKDVKVEFEYSWMTSSSCFEKAMRFEKVFESLYKNVLITIIITCPTI